MKTVLFLLLGIAAGLLLVALFRTLKAGKKKSTYVPAPNPARAMDYAKKLSEMVQFETVSYPDQDRTERFEEFHDLLAGLFPTVFSQLEVTSIDGNLLIFWKGKSSERPVVLMGHQDVVPAEGDWDRPAFSGDIEDGKVWGRGSNDTKCSVLCILQTLEELLLSGYEPGNDVYVTSSCTEETFGDGASKLVAELERRGVHPFLVIDEGGAIVQEPIAGIGGNFAMIGVLEKGMGDLRFIARSPGGHSSTPEKNSPIVRLAKFETAVERKSPFRKAFTPEAEAMFSTLAPYVPSFALRLMFGNLWLFKGILAKVMSIVSSQADAMLGTTIAFTMQSGSKAFNVMPQSAHVGANMRFIPHQDCEESIRIIRDLASEYDLETEVVSAYPACPVVDIQGDGYRLVTETVEEVFPGLPHCPYVMTGGTDSRHYGSLCRNVIRFSPIVYGKEQLSSMHGLNENIEYASLPGAVDFYKALLRRNDMNTQPGKNGM